MVLSIVVRVFSFNKSSELHDVAHVARVDLAAVRLAVAVAARVDADVARGCKNEALV